MKKNDDGKADWKKTFLLGFVSLSLSVYESFFLEDEVSVLILGEEEMGPVIRL